MKSALEGWRSKEKHFQSSGDVELGRVELAARNASEPERIRRGMVEDGNGEMKTTMENTATSGWWTRAGGVKVRGRGLLSRRSRCTAKLGPSTPTAAPPG